MYLVLSTRSKSGRMCFWRSEPEASLELKHKECVAGAIAWGISPSIWPDSICIALLCSPKQLAVVKDTKGPENNFLEPENVTSTTEKNYCRPGKDPEIDGGHLLTGEAKRSSGILAAIHCSRDLSKGEGHALLGSTMRVTLTVEPRGDGDLDRDNMDTQGGAEGSKLRQSYVYSWGSGLSGVWGNGKEWACQTHI